MIDLNKVGFEIKETSEGIVVKGGVILSAQCQISSLCAYPDAVKEHAMERIKEMIWAGAYNEIYKEVQGLTSFLSDPLMEFPGIPEKFLSGLMDHLHKLQEVVVRP